MTQRAYKFRIYPNADQRQRLAREFGCARCGWNKALELRSTAWSIDKTRHNYGSLGRVARIHAKVAAMRSDFLHKTTTAVIRQNDVIALEDLNVAGMMKNHHLAGAIAAVGMGELRRQIEYKADWYGRIVVVANRWAPTSKTCSECGWVQASLSLSVREWDCVCGAHHDRDLNAAKNILQFGTAGYAGIDARGVSKNLSGHVPDTHDEARTDVEKFTYADRMDRAA